MCLMGQTEGQEVAETHMCLAIILPHIDVASICLPCKRIPWKHRRPVLLWFYPATIFTSRIASCLCLSWTHAGKSHITNTLRSCAWSVSRLIMHTRVHILNAQVQDLESSKLFRQGMSAMGDMWDSKTVPGLHCPRDPKQITTLLAPFLDNLGPSLLPLPPEGLHQRADLLLADPDAAILGLLAVF